MRKGFMYIDETITLDFNMPEELKEELTILDSAFENEDTATWDMYHESLGEYVKGLYSAGAITSKQMHMIWERYGTAG